MTPTHRHRLAALASATLLAACGGGGGSPSQPQPVASLRLTGVAATGRAIANAPVQAKCSSGSGTATTQTNGDFAIEIAGGSLPCVLAVTTASGGMLHSAIDGSGSGAVNVNITPLTELVLARVAAGAPAGVFATFDAAAQAKIGTAALSAAVASVAAALQGAVDLTGVNPIKDTLVAANGSTAGNALDQKLDTLQAVLGTARTTLAELTVAMASGGDPGAATKTMLQPAASGCASLRSGRYVGITPRETDRQWSISQFTLDAQLLTDGLGTWTDDGGCAYTVPDDPGSTKVLVSKSGLMVSRNTMSGGQADFSVIVPIQAIPLAELVGTWNFLEHWPDDTTRVYAPGGGTLSIAANGNLSLADCAGLGACSPSTAAGTLSADAAGGFSANNAEGTRAFAFKTASGEMSLFIINPTIGGFLVATKQRPLSLPAVGTVTNFWDFTLGSNGLASPLSEASTSVTAVNSAAGSFTRQRASDGRIDSFTINQPRNGLRHRAAGSSPTHSGGTVNFSEILVLPLADTGISFYTSVAPTENVFGISVGKP